MALMTSPEEASVAELLRGALDEATLLAQLEIALAKNEIRKEARAAATSAVAFGVAAVMALLAIVMLLFSLVLAISKTWVTPLCIAGALLTVGAAAGLLGYRALPKKPLAETRLRLGQDVKQLKARMA